MVVPVDSIPAPADGLDAAVWCGFAAATAFALALRWALDFTAPPAADERPQPGLTAEQHENLRGRL